MSKAAPQEIVARDFMARKGYPDIEPFSVRQCGRFVWEFVYELSEGDLVLSVQWLEHRREWSAGVLDFALTS